MTNQLFAQLSTRFQANANLEYGKKQSAYLRHKFTFFGIRHPQIKAITKDFIKENDLAQIADLQPLIKNIFQGEQREFHHASLVITEHFIKKQSADFIEMLEFLIVTNSWWDTVDHAAKLVGMHFQRYPDLIIPTTERWMESENMWLQRVSIIFQLRYKEATDWELLQRYILAVSDSEEFFLQKAAGWALRQYSRTRADRVVAFVQSYELPKLTAKEALRLLK
ncbi:MAG: DNA alkylation repair protein [Saprospiraceae bacterium]